LLQRGLLNKKRIEISFASIKKRNWGNISIESCDIEELKEVIELVELLRTSLAT